MDLPQTCRFFMMIWMTYLRRVRCLMMIWMTYLRCVRCFMMILMTYLRRVRCLITVQVTYLRCVRCFVMIQVTYLRRAMFNDDIGDLPQTCAIYNSNRGICGIIALSDLYSFSTVQPDAINFMTRSCVLGAQCSNQPFKRCNFAFKLGS